MPPNANLGRRVTRRRSARSQPAPCAATTGAAPSASDASIYLNGARRPRLFQHHRLHRSFRLDQRGFRSSAPDFQHKLRSGGARNQSVARAGLSTRPSRKPRPERISPETPARFSFLFFSHVGRVRLIRVLAVCPRPQRPRGFRRRVGRRGIRPWSQCPPQPAISSGLHRPNPDAAGRPS
jgi:hypothetical protein